MTSQDRPDAPDSASAARPVVGLLLAAGFSRRFGAANKLCQPLATGEWVAVRAARHLLQALPHSLAVVRAEDTALAAALSAIGLQVVRCEAPTAEQSDSLRLAVASAQTLFPHLAGVVVALGDMPMIQPATLRRVADLVAVASPTASLVQPVFRGQPGHPVGFAAHWLPALLALRGDQGARALLRSQPEALVRLDCDDPGCVQDIDTPADLAAVQAAQSAT